MFELNQNQIELLREIQAQFKLKPNLVKDVSCSIGEWSELDDEEIAEAEANGTVFKKDSSISFCAID